MGVGCAASSRSRQASDTFHRCLARTRKGKAVSTLPLRAGQRSPEPSKLIKGRKRTGLQASLSASTASWCDAKDRMHVRPAR
jgi:hypothetical protein